MGRNVSFFIEIIQLNIFYAEIKEWLENLKAEMKEKKNMSQDVLKYEELLELLRTRLSVLNTSVFLLEENLSINDPKTNEYLEKINDELERIRKIIIEVPEKLRSN